MRASAAAGAAVLLGAALAGCTYNPHPEVLAKAQALLPTEQFRVKVTQRPEQIALGVHAGGLSPNQEAALAQFISRWREDGGGAVTLQAPGGSRRMAEATVNYIAKLGVPGERIRVLGAPVAAAQGAPLVVSYDRFEALGPNCSGGWADLTTTGGNAPYDHFGCAITANIAAQVANPRDFLAPAVEMPADDSRREVVLGKYRRGETTSTAADQQASGRASDTQ